jgi:hypothetical protein
MKRLWLLLLFAVALIGTAAQDRREGTLRPGSLAPDFTLQPRGGGESITLSSFRDKSPVALVFGSYT